MVARHARAERTKETTSMSHDSIPSAPTRPESSLTGSRSRRTFLAGVGAASLALASTSLLDTAHVSAAGDPTKIKAIFTIARTAEQLAVTFYSHGLRNANQLGFNPEQRNQIHAALVEEQIHQQFFTANGGDSLADTFSFPHGDETFENRRLFIETQQQLEGVFDSAFLAAVREFAEMGEARLAQIAAQISCVESEHRVLGRDIGNLEPADNWTYAPVLIAYVADAPQLVKDAGYLNPRRGNSYKYQAVDTSLGGILYKEGPFSKRT